MAPFGVWPFGERIVSMRATELTPYPDPLACDDAEAARRIRMWLAADSQDPFSWPTDGCGYDQHMRFVEYRNTRWSGGGREEWRAFVADYAAELAKPSTPKEEE